MQQQQQEDEGRRARRKSPLSELGERLAYQLRNAEVGLLEDMEFRVLDCLGDFGCGRIGM